jgi:hypothetical protein
MTVIAIAPAHDSPGKKDASGAFLVEARAFVRLHGGKLLTFDNRREPAARFVEVIDLLHGRRADAVGFFCHGHRNGLQIGATLRNAHVLAAALRDVGAASVPLYACDAARDNDADRSDDSEPGPGGAGGFASTLSAALPGVVIDAHTTAAHTTRNPHVRRFMSGGDGAWLVEPGSPLWRTWRDALRDRDFRLSFPLLSSDAIAACLSARRVA